MNKNNIITKEDLEQYYKSCRKIRFNENFKPEEQADLFLEIFKKLFMYQDATFTVRLKHQCNANKMRSIDDFIKIVKYYLPEMTVSEIFKRFKEIITIPENMESVKDRGCYPGLYYCNNIRKLNVHRWSTPPVYSVKGNISYLEKTLQYSGFKNCELKHSEI